MRVGIPRALLYYYYYPFWKTMFDALKIETVVSEPTSKMTVNKGVEFSVPEICVPIKIFTGHVASLIDEVDYVFIPRMMSISKHEYFCPKFMGLPDMIKYTVPGAMGKILSPKITAHTDNISNPKYYTELKTQLGIGTWELQRALKKAEKEWQKFRNLSKQGYVLTDALNIFEDKNVADKKIEKEKNRSNDIEVTIGLLGYVYDIYDSYVSMDVIQKLKDLNIKIVTFEMLDDDEMNNSIRFMNKKLFWTFSNKLLGAGYHFYHDPQVDGLIQVTAFGCGPDSMIGKMLELDASKYDKPFMTVRVDEHSGESHLQTRVEAFIDMIKRKKLQTGGGLRHESNLSIHGNNAGL
ncbi:acyl-CoA dehydratase activase-related protein [Clostridiaceae bacterium 35-E11]